MSKTKRFRASTESLDDYDEDVIGFIEGEINVGNPLVTFNFGAKPEQVSQPGSMTSGTIFSFGANPKSFSQRGSTPPVHGEFYTIKRCYQYRQSTIRKLNELKAKHSDVNVYLNTIIDEAISHYYDYVFNSNTN